MPKPLDSIGASGRISRRGIRYLQGLARGNRLKYPTAGLGLSVSYQEEKAIPRDHPCLAGHFPGLPIVPGSLLLEEVKNTFANWQPEDSIQGFQSVKFLQSLPPDQLVSIQIEQTGDGRFGFECHSQGLLIAHGKLLSHP